MINCNENLLFANNQREVDHINSEFYGKIKYPWPPAAFERINRPDFWNKMISQDIGYWYQNVVPEKGAIWVAGCGTNQALFTALKFPNSFVTGSDLSEESLALCKKNAKQLNITNLELRNESINEILYSNTFDYIICTGVIHHNADPEISLDKLAKALKDNGILELMVYNKFHRIERNSFQLAVRLLTQCTRKPNLEKELPAAKKLIRECIKQPSLTSNLLEEIGTAPAAAFCDEMLQPVEHSYSIQSLEKMASKCNLEILNFCIDQFSRVESNYNWNLIFEDFNMQETYEALPDITRWEITNLLKREKSPLLWFYLQRKDCSRLRKTEKEICHDFLHTKFKKVSLTKEVYVQNQKNNYENTSMAMPFPPQAKHWLCPEAKQIYINLMEDRAIGHTFEKYKINTSFSSVNRIRSLLATSAFPYLEAYC